MPQSVLTVAGVAYNQSARKTNKLLVDAWGWDLDDDYWLEFHEVVAGPQPQFTGPFACSLTIDFGSGPIAVFTGTIVSVTPSYGADGRTWGYRALGLKYSANWIPVVAVDGSGLIRMNVDPSEFNNYLPALAGLSVGGMISYCLTQHATALTAVGITTDSTTASQLAALTLVPNNEVDVAGSRLWQAMESILVAYARNIRLVILPTGLVRVVDVTAGTAENLVLGVDPVDPPLLASNWTHAATRQVVRGQGLIEPAYVSTALGTLTPAWNSTQQAAWTEASFTNPAGALDAGNVMAVTSPTTVNLQSTTSPLYSGGVNYWSGLQAWIYLQSSTLVGLQYTEARQITASTVAAGGAYTVTLNYPLQNTSYNTYRIVGTNVPLTSGGLSQVWRTYNVTDPGGQVANHLVRQFATEVPFVSANGQSAVLTQYPMCQVFYTSLSSGGGPFTVGGNAPFVVDPIAKTVTFIRPVVELGNTIANCVLGGAHVVAPNDIYMLLAYSRGALHTTYPPDVSGVPQYSGSAYSVGGLQRTAYADVPTWTYFGNSPVLAQLAQMLQTSTKNTIVEGGVRYKGFWQPALNPTGGATPGYLLSFSASWYTTGWESLQIPIRSYTITYQVKGGGLNYVTDMRVSTRQDPRTGENFYNHLSVLGTPQGIQPRFEGFMHAGQIALPDTYDAAGLGAGSLTQFQSMDTSGMAEALGLGSTAEKEKPRRMTRVQERIAQRQLRRERQGIADEREQVIAAVRAREMSGAKPEYGADTRSGMMDEPTPGKQAPKGMRERMEERRERRKSQGIADEREQVIAKVRAREMAGEIPEHGPGKGIAEEGG